MERPFEQVYTVYDFYDLPRAGLADLGAVPHVYRAIWREDLDDWDPANRYELSPVDAATLNAAMETWAILRRWEAAHYAGQAPDSPHPALPHERDRYLELAPLIERALEVDQSRRRVAVGEFRARGGAPMTRAEAGPRPGLEVRWTPVD